MGAPSKQQQQKNQIKTKTMSRAINYELISMGDSCKCPLTFDHHVLYQYITRQTILNPVRMFLKDIYLSISSSKLGPKQKLWEQE